MSEYRIVFDPDRLLIRDIVTLDRAGRGELSLAETVAWLSEHVQVFAGDEGVSIEDLPASMLHRIIEHIADTFERQRNGDGGN